MHIANGTNSPLQQPKVYLGNKLSVNPSVQNGGFYKKKKSADGGCGCGSNKRPKQVRKKVE